MSPTRTLSSESSEDEMDELQDQSEIEQELDNLLTNSPAKAETSTAVQKKKVKKRRSPSERSTATSSKRRVETEHPEFDIRLPPQRSVHKSIRELMELLKSQIIDLNPDYQRDEVWPTVKGQKLIRSLLQNVYVPPLVFNITIPDPTDLVFSDENPSKVTESHNNDMDLEMHRKKVPREVWVCADGKQRLTNIKKFMDGVFGLPDDVGQTWYWRLDKVTKVRKPLPPLIKRRFENIRFSCVSYDSLEMRQETLLFQMIQQGTPLSVDEKRRAEPGSNAGFIERLVVDYCRKPMTGFSTRIIYLSRAKDFASMLRICNLIQAGFSTNIAVYNSQSAKPLSDLEKSTIIDLLDRFTSLSLLPTRQTHPIFLSPRKLSPLEFYLIPWLIYKYWDWKNGELLEAIEIIRAKGLEAFHNELKLKAPTLTTYNNWILELDRGQFKGLYDDDGIKQGGSPPPAPAEPDNPTKAAKTKSATPTSASRGKPPTSKKTKPLASKSMTNDQKNTLSAPKTTTGAPTTPLTTTPLIVNPSAIAPLTAPLTVSASTSTLNTLNGVESFNTATVSPTKKRPSIDSPKPPKPAKMPKIKTESFDMPVKVKPEPGTPILPANQAPQIKNSNRFKRPKVSDPRIRHPLPLKPPVPLSLSTNTSNSSAAQPPQVGTHPTVPASNSQAAAMPQITTQSTIETSQPHPTMVAPSSSNPSTQPSLVQTADIKPQIPDRPYYPFQLSLNSSPVITIDDSSDEDTKPTIKTEQSRRFPIINPR